jgi:DNA-binding transcriptional ArsR family regulator
VGERGAEPARGGGVSEPDVDAVFAALADATRRHVLTEVDRRGGATATELAADLPVTRQAVAKHLGVLADARLVDAHRSGRELRYRVTPEPLGEAIGWMTRVGGEWDERLARLQRLMAPQARD